MNMKRTIVVAAALLASALSAHAAPVKKHPAPVKKHLSAHAAPVKKHLRVVNGRACHEIVITNKQDAVRYALGIFSGQIPLPQMDELRRCYPRTPDNENSDDSLIFSSPSPDEPPVAPAPGTYDTPYVAPTAPTPDNPNCGGGLC
jgi:hypothetical protein